MLVMFKSQYGQDKFLYENFFKSKKEGTFVDIGAHDGIELSNTYFFEQLGWTGMCIEPNPNVYNKLINNRKCLTINGAAWYEDTVKKFRLVNGYSEMLSGIVDTYNKLHETRIDTECNSTGGSFSDININCYNITELLIKNNLLEIDFMSIDTEGSEFEIIKGIDFTKIKVNLFLVENNYEDARIINLLSKNGYKLHTRLQIDDVYVKIL